MLATSPHPPPHHARTVIRKRVLRPPKLARKVPIAQSDSSEGDADPTSNYSIELDYPYYAGKAHPNGIVYERP